MGDDARLVGETLDRKGAFVIRNVFPGSYILQAQLSKNQEHYSARRDLHVGDSDVEAVNLTITSGRIEGFALTSDSLPAAGVYVVAIPDAPFGSQEWKCREEVTDHGRFRLRSILPGKYRIFSCDCADDFDWYDPEQLEPYESKFVSVDLREGDQKRCSLP